MEVKRSQTTVVTAVGSSKISTRSKRSRRTRKIRFEPVYQQNYDDTTYNAARRGQRTTGCSCHTQATRTPRLRKPENFTGTNPKEFPIWLAKFEVITKAGGWDGNDTKLKTLPAYLSKQAFQIYDKLLTTEKGSYTLFVEALQKKMGIGERIMTWKVQLR